MSLVHKFSVALTHGVFLLVIVIIFQVGEFAVNAEKRLFAILRPCIVLVGSEVQDLFLMGSCSR